MKMKVAILTLLLGVITFSENIAAHGVHSGRWHAKYSDVLAVPAVLFSYPHGVLAGSYSEEGTTTEIRFGDVCAYLGHVCLCGAGGFQIASDAVSEIRDTGKPLERGEFILISSRDHTVADVIAFTLGCSRRTESAKNQHFIRPVDGMPKREYRYVVGYPPTRTAVQIIYKKHLLVGNEAMDDLWRIELAHEEDPGSVDSSDVEMLQETMETMVRDVLLDRKEGLITTQVVPYEEFAVLLDSLRGQ